MNLYRLFGLDKENAMVYEVLKEINEDIVKGEISQMMTFEFMVREIEGKIGGKREYGRIYEVMKGKGGALDQERVKGIIEYVGE